ncbi:unnamed protein product, partial [Rhizoctonia solani]
YVWTPGKTRRADQLKAYLEQKLQEDHEETRGWKVSVLADESLNIPRSSYDGMPNAFLLLNPLMVCAESRLEKPARSALLSAIVRDLSKNTILIVDSLNYIKGFRYQMYCAAREVGVRVATVGRSSHTRLVWRVEPEAGKQIQRCNASTCLDFRFHSLTPTNRFDNLIQRYEEPNSMVRWDAPLFTIPWTDETVPGEDIWRAITLGDKRPANQAVA